MVKFEFGSTLHRSSRDMHNAIAQEWLSAGGLNDRETMLQFLEEKTDADLAADAIGGWALAEHPDFDRDELAQAFRETRRNFELLFPVE